MAKIRKIIKLELVKKVIYFLRLSKKLKRYYKKYLTYIRDKITYFSKNRWQ